MSVLRHAIVGSGMVPPRPLRVFLTPWMVLFSVGHLFPGMRYCTISWLLQLQRWKMLQILHLLRREMIQLLHMQSRGIVRLFCLECWKMLRLLRLKRRKMIRLLLQRRKWYGCFNVGNGYDFYACSFRKNYKYSACGVGKCYDHSACNLGKCYTPWLSPP